MWMKQNQNYSGCTGNHSSPDGTNALIWNAAVLDAYAHYLSLFVSAYKTHGINVTAMMVQNEPYANGCNYPKCEWTGAQMRDFVRDHAGPVSRGNSPPPVCCFLLSSLRCPIPFGGPHRSPTNRPSFPLLPAYPSSQRFAADHAGECSMWLGTLNTEDFLECPNTVLADVDTRKYIGGAALQWAGKGMVQRVQQTFGADLPLIQSENECGDGSNTWDYAMVRWHGDCESEFIFSGPAVVVLSHQPMNPPTHRPTDPPTPPTPPTHRPANPNPPNMPPPPSQSVVHLRLDAALPWQRCGGLRVLVSESGCSTRPAFAISTGPHPTQTNLVHLSLLEGTRF